MFISDKFRYREDLRYKTRAEEMGFTARRDYHEGGFEVPAGGGEFHLNWPLVFQKGTSRVWLCKNGWQTADLIDNRYINHKIFNTLLEALEYKK